MANSLDKSRYFVTDIEDTKGKLFRGENAAGELYSYIEEDGVEIVSAPTDDENGMIKYYLGISKCL